MLQRQCTRSKLATSTRFSVVLTCLLIEILLCCKFGHGNSAPGGGYANPSMYGSYQNNNQQHWPSQQQQQQYHPQNQYFDNDQYQQQQQQQQQPDQSASTIEEVAPPSLPPRWSEHIDPSSGQPYYYNANDGSTTWDRPPPLPNANETIIENEGMQQQQQFDSPQSYSLSLSNNTDSKEDLLNEGAGRVETLAQTNPEGLPVIDAPINSLSPDDDALTSIGRDENKIHEEEQWRESQGWNAPQSDKIDSGTNHNSNIGIENDTSMKQHSQGWNLPPPQNQANNAWGISRTPQDGMPEHAAINTDEQMSQTRHPAVPTPNQSQQQKQSLDEPPFPQESSIPSDAGLGSKMNIAPPHFHRPPERDDGKQVQPTTQHRVSDSTGPIEQASPRINVDGMNQRQVPQYQASQQDAPRYVQQPPPTAYSRPPPVQGNPYQYTQQRPGVPGQPPYPQHQGSNPYSQQPQRQDGANYRQHAGRPLMNQYPPPNQVNPQQGYSPQPAGQAGQLITQEQQNLVKESLGRTWQSILGLKDKTKEVVETATSTVAQSAREATQTIAEKGTGWWGQAKSVIGSVFESEPIQEYSLSGIYGNAPPAPAKQDPPRNYPMNQKYPPQSRYPPQQQYPPQGPGQQQLPPQGRYPPGYAPPQPRVDTPYPYQQQDSRQAMSPIQRQVDGNVPQQRYPPQNRPYDPSRNEYNQQMRPGQQAPPPQQQQQHPRNPDDASSAWSHPGLTSDY